MKALVKLLLGGFAGFMVLAMAQEWEVFASAWFGASPTPVTISAEDQKDAADTLHLTLSLVGHAYASGGDPRYSERMPASAAVLEELQRDIDYLTRNHRRQAMSLERLDVISLTPLDGDSLAVRTRELWEVRFLWVSGAGEADPPRRQTTRGDYLLVRGQRGWRVERWEVL